MQDPTSNDKPASTTSFSKGILGDLKKEADQARQLKEAEAARLARLEEIYHSEIIPRMLSIHSYLFDLVEQLNTLSWSVQTEYDFPGIGLVSGLAQENYRVNIDSTDKPKRVVLTFACRAPDERRYSVEANKADETQKFFITQQIRSTEWPNRTPAGQIREIVYQARLQILVTIVCQADVAKSKIVVSVANLEGISVKRHEFSYTEIDEEWLDRLGNYILRKLDTIGKSYISDDERQALRERLAQAQEKERLQNEKMQSSGEDEKNSLLGGLKQKLFSSK